MVERVGVSDQPDTRSSRGYPLYIANRVPVLSIESTRHLPPGVQEFREGRPIHM